MRTSTGRMHEGDQAWRYHLETKDLKSGRSLKKKKKKKVGGLKYQISKWSQEK